MAEYIDLIFSDHLLEGKRETLSSCRLYITYPALLLTKVNSLVPVLINALNYYMLVCVSSSLLRISTLFIH